MAALLSSPSLLQLTTKGPIFPSCIYFRIILQIIRRGLCSNFQFPSQINHLCNIGRQMGSCRLTHISLHNNKRTQFQCSPFAVRSMCCSKPEKKQVWIWTEKKEVMTAAVERGWDTLIFHSQSRELAAEWSCKHTFSQFLCFWINCVSFSNFIN